MKRTLIYTRRQRTRAGAHSLLTFARPTRALISPRKFSHLCLVIDHQTFLTLTFFLLHRTGVEPHLMVRQSIPVGPEVSPEEAASGNTAGRMKRGLAFVAYQSSIANSFEFVQKCTVPFICPAHILFKIVY